MNIITKYTYPVYIWHLQLPIEDGGIPHLDSTSVALYLTASMNPKPPPPPPSYLPFRNMNFHHIAIFIYFKDAYRRIEVMFPLLCILLYVCHIRKITQYDLTPLSISFIPSRQSSVAVDN